MRVSQQLPLVVTLQTKMKLDQIRLENAFLLYAKLSFSNKRELTKTFIISNVKNKVKINQQSKYLVAAYASGTW